MLKSLVLLLSLVCAIQAQTSLTISPGLVRFREEANQPFPPVHIIDNVYHVGAANIAVYLITTTNGHFLMDSGFAETVPIICSNIQQLGFKVEDIKFLLSSHSHIDHVAGHALMKKLTGARVFAMERDAEILAAGGKGDFRWENEARWEPVQIDQIMKDGESVSLGGVTLQAHLTPGHSVGNATWTTTAREGDTNNHVVFAGSTSINSGVVLANNVKYPTITTDYERSFELLKALPCDVFLTGHGNVFGLAEKYQRIKAGAASNPFIDPEGYRTFLRQSEKVFRDQLQRERLAIKP